MNPRAWWSSRPPRERSQFAGGAAAGVLVLLFTFVWLPMERTRTRVAAELPALRASLAEMRAQAEEVKALRALPAREAPASATPLATLVASGSLAQGLPGARLSMLGARRLKLAVDDASWTRLVEWIAAAGASHGLSVEEATVEALPAAGRVRASLVLAAP
jgi:general secretion pathway protein M